MCAKREFRQSTTSLGFIGAEESVAVAVAVVVAVVVVAVVEAVVVEAVVVEAVVAGAVVVGVAWCPLVSFVQPFHTFEDRKTETHLCLNRYPVALRLSHQRQAFLHAS